VESKITKMIILRIQEKIFTDFFKELVDAKLPEDLIKELRTLLEKGEIENKEKILEAVRRGTKGANKNQSH
jgi:divalent metal cation (Fe/Co/Zn/Cd) transporter